jgi:Na+-translocating ferredoxin:NAD+ oxidoreductase subunit B
MFPAIISLTLLGLSLGLALGFAARVFRVESNPLVEEVERMLPGSQCGQCGYPGCSPAAAAIANGEVAVTICPPGGKILAEELAAKLGVSIDLSGMREEAPKLAAIDENNCIGCTRCFKVCPTDAIIGGPKQIHAVIRDACTGCGVCVTVCPTECLQLHGLTVTLKNWRWHKPQAIAA